MKYLLAQLFFCLFGLHLAIAQVQIGSISIEGNRRTKEKTILRELNFQVGDSIEQSALTARLERNRLLLINTGLFNKVEINIAQWEGDVVDLIIQLKEDWYIYPIPIFELADRNFNVWWRDYNHRFNRLNLGLRFYFDNLTGRNDRLKAVTQFGYTQKYELEYRLPFFNKGQSLGLSYNILHTRNREVSVRTQDNKQQFLRTDDKHSLLRFRNRARLSYRPGLFIKHQVEAAYYRNQVSDTVVLSNPDFFLNQKSVQQYFSLEYEFTLDRRDNKDYPQKGVYLELLARKDGFGWSKEVNKTTVASTFAQYFEFNKGFGYEYLVKGQSALFRKKQPYYDLSNALGYEEDFIRGYEFYVIDGLDFAYLKNSLRFKLLDRAFSVKRMPLNALNYFPLKIFIKLNADVGYANSPFGDTANDLQNRWLFGGGPAIDIVLYHEYVVRLEYSINHLGEKGLFLHYNFFF